MAVHRDPKPKARRKSKGAANGAAERTPKGLADPKSWTVMIYMIADDPKGGELLDRLATREIDEIVAAALDDRHQFRDSMHVAVQVDFRTLPDVWRRVVGEGTWIQPESSGADPATLYGFFDWVAQYCPADRYMLMFWGHSRGPFGLFSDLAVSSVLGGPFASDDPNTYVAQTLTLKELRVALGNARLCLDQEVDIIAFKDCFMSTLEAAYELKGSANYILASQEIVPIPGWPYRKIFGHLAKQRDAKPAAKAILDELHAHYGVKENRYRLPRVPFTLLETSAVANVSDPLRLVATALSKRPSLRKLLPGAAGRDTGLLDVATLCKKLRTTPETREAVAQLEKAIDDVIIQPSNGHTNGGNGQQKNGADKRPSGVSLFVYPQTKRERVKSIVAAHATREVYEDLAIAKTAKTGWDIVALRSMPVAPKANPPRPNGSYTNSDYEGRGTLLPGVLEQLQRGILEEIARNAFGFGPKGLGFGPKGLGFGPKGLGFGDKGLGFGPKGLGFGDKGLGFGDKGLGFAAEFEFAKGLGFFDAADDDSDPTATVARKGARKKPQGST